MRRQNDARKARHITRNTAKLLTLRYRRLTAKDAQRLAEVA